MIKSFKGLSYLFIAAGLLALSVLFYWHSYLNNPISQNSEDISIQVQSGQSFASLARQLEEQGVWQYPVVMTKYVQYFKPDFVLKAGEYRFRWSQTPNEMLHILNEGQVISYRITLIEGDALKDILLRVRQSSHITQSLPQDEPEDNLRALLNHDRSSTLEGWFFPDTYFYSRGDTDADILLRAYRKMQAVLDEAWAGRSAGLPYKNAYEALIMASLIEKETGAAFERPQIAGVFVRRLEKNMRLQTDPTVIYALGDDFNGDLKRSHLKVDSPYNTYRYKGLPPSPIASPGRGAILAAMHPAEGTALYFVGKGDGTHYFSDTLEAHQRAVRQYQINNRRSDYRSSPPVQLPADSNAAKQPLNIGSG